MNERHHFLERLRDEQEFMDNQIRANGAPSSLTMMKVKELEGLVEQYSREARGWKVKYDEDNSLTSETVLIPPPPRTR